MLNHVRRIGSILIALSLAIASACWVSDIHSIYYGGEFPLTEQSSHLFIVFLYNREAQIMMDLKMNTDVEFAMMGPGQIQTFLSRGVVTYFIQSNVRGGLNRTLGIVEQGAYILFFNSTDRNQVVRMQLFQKGPEYNLLILSVILFALGILLVLASFILSRFFQRRV